LSRDVTCLHNTTGLLQEQPGGDHCENRFSGDDHFLVACKIKINKIIDFPPQILYEELQEYISIKKHKKWVHIYDNVKKKSNEIERETFSENCSIFRNKNPPLC
jgi:hypothetical protein